MVVALVMAAIVRWHLGQSPRALPPDVPIPVGMYLDALGVVRDHGIPTAIQLIVRLPEAAALLEAVNRPAELVASDAIVTVR